ncbi:MAG: hypothetical protein Kow0092_14840 [Deferrisomatales bacterium]
MNVPPGFPRHSGRPPPGLTYGIAGLCLLAFLLGQCTGRSRMRHGLRTLAQAVRFHQEHAYLDLDPRLEGLYWGAVPRSGPVPEPSFTALEQAELDGLTDAGFDALRASPQWRWGFVPNRLSPVTPFTHLFVHAGWLSLLANLALLYLSAPFLERAWGRGGVAGLFVASGLAAAAAFAVRHPHLEVPLVGATGAVAGVVGALAVRQGRRRLRYSYRWFRGRQGSVAVGAWLLLPLWIAREALGVYALDVVAPGGSGFGAGFWAHLTALGFGAAAAGVLRLRGLEARLFPKSGDDGPPSQPILSVEEARHHHLLGRTEQAWAALSSRVGRNPEEADAVLALWELAAETGRAKEAAVGLVRLARRCLARGDGLEAREHWERLRQGAPVEAVPLGLDVKLAEVLRAAGLERDAADVLEWAAERARAADPPGALARLALMVEGQHRERVAGLALGRPDLPEPLRHRLRALAPGTPREPGPGASDPEAPAARSQGKAPRPIAVLRGVPLSLEDGALTVEIDGLGPRRFSVDWVQAAHAAVVDEGGVEPNRILDLVLRPPRERPEVTRIVRMETLRFDPRRLLPSEPELDDALLRLAEAILEACRARWLRGERIEALPRYPSRRAYERDLLTALARFREETGGHRPGGLGGTRRSHRSATR